MRSTGSGPLGALLMLAPLIAVPILAVVGIPQFAPGNLLDPNGSSSRSSSSRERRAPQEPGYGDDANRDADDLFESLDKSQEKPRDFEDPLDSRRGRKDTRRSQSDSDVDFETNVPSPESDESENLDVDRDPRETDPGSFDQDSESSNAASDSFRKRSRPAPERYADAFMNEGSVGRTEPGRSSKSSQRPSKSQTDNSQFEEESNPFEPPPSKGRPSKRVPAPKRPVHPDDAPPFVPPPGSSNDAEDESAEEVSPRAPQTRPRVSQPEVPAEPADSTPEGTSKNTEEDPALESTEKSPQLDELTWQTATKRLRALGVGKSKQHFTYVEDRNLFLFTCTAIHRDDSTLTQRFQAEAEEPLLAVRQVLEKLESWQDSDLKPKSRPRTTPRASL